MYRACEIFVYRHYTSNLNEPEIFNKEKWAKKKALCKTGRETREDKKGKTARKKGTRREKVK